MDSEELLNKQGIVYKMNEICIELTGPITFGCLDEEKEEIEIEIEEANKEKY